MADTFPRIEPSICGRRNPKAFLLRREFRRAKCSFCRQRVRIFRILPNPCAPQSTRTLLTGVLIPSSSGLLQLRGSCRTQVFMHDAKCTSLVALENLRRAAEEHVELHPGAVGANLVCVIAVRVGGNRGVCSNDLHLDRVQLRPRSGRGPVTLARSPHGDQLCRLAAFTLAREDDGGGEYISARLSFSFPDRMA